VAASLIEKTYPGEMVRGVAANIIFKVLVL